MFIVERTNEKHEDKNVSIYIPEEGDLSEFPYAPERDRHEPSSTFLFHDLLCVRIDLGAVRRRDDESEIHEDAMATCVLYCLYIPDRKEWIGIVQQCGYFDSVTHLDEVWDEVSYTLLPEHGALLLQSYGVRENALAVQQAISTSPEDLQRMASLT
jgi:hypothetical protein